MFVRTWFGLFYGLFLVQTAPTFAGFDLGQLSGLNLVKRINAIIALDSLTTNLISINFDVYNPLVISLVIDNIRSSASLNGTIYATFDHLFIPPFVIPPFQLVNSGTINNVHLTQGALGTLDIIPAGILDIESDIVLQVIRGLPIPVHGLKQSSVPTNYTLDIPG